MVIRSLTRFPVGMFNCQVWTGKAVSTVDMSGFLIVLTELADFDFL